MYDISKAINDLVVFLKNLIWQRLHMNLPWWVDHQDVVLLFVGLSKHLEIKVEYVTIDPLSVLTCLKIEDALLLAFFKAWRNKVCPPKLLIRSLLKWHTLEQLKTFALVKMKLEILWVDLIVNVLTHFLVTTCLKV